TETGLSASWPKKGPPVVWDKDVGEGFSGPVVVGDRVVLFHRVGGEEVVECLGAADGATKWKKGYPTSYRDEFGKGDGTRASPVAADLAGRRQAVFLTREGLLSLDPADGTVRYSKHWRSRIDASVNAASPVVVGDQIFLTASYGTGAVLLRAKKDGLEEVWKG